MRPLLLIGVILIGLGAFVLIRGGSFTSREDVLKVGDLKVTATEEQSIPPWVGVAGIIAGAIVIVVGARTRT